MRQEETIHAPLSLKFNFQNIKFEISLPFLPHPPSSVRFLT